MYKSIKVLYEDEHLIAFDKPSGLLVVPSPKEEKKTLVRLVNEHGAPGQPRLYPCHRLDRDTSGAILFAKGKRMQQCMRRAFEERSVQKSYIAFVRGRMRRLSGVMNKPVRDFHQRRHTPRSRPLPAVTRYRVKTVKKGFSVLEVFPKTGRTNQIRIHFSDAGHPILGERLYALGRDFPIKFRRLALHAAQLTWPHPIRKRMVSAISPLPADMKNFLSKH